MSGVGGGLGVGLGVGETNSALGTKEMKRLVSVAVREINTYFICQFSVVNFDGIWPASWSSGQSL